MQEIIIGFSRPKKWKPFAWLIMTAYYIPYDHVYIKLASKTYDRDIIYQASNVSVNFMSPAIFTANNIVVKEFELQVSDETRKKVMQFAIDNAGKPYGVKDILGLAWVRINELFGKTIKNPLSDDDSTYVCSELVAKILVDFTDIKLKKDVNDMTPLDVYNALTLVKG